jgi:hypothetical protein
VSATVRLCCLNDTACHDDRAGGAACERSCGGEAARASARALAEWGAVPVNKEACLPALPAAAVCIVAAALGWPRLAHADAGPPYLTNDPGTPGSANWEINIGSMQSIERGVASYQLPQIDVNFGVGDRIQLTYEIPYVLQTRDGAPTASAWSNAYPGVKWRFFDEGEDGWQLSTFPQFETAGSAPAQRAGIAAPGSRLLLPLEVARAVGPLKLNFEAGYYLEGRAERILGFVAGGSVSARLELDAELYNDHVLGTSPDVTTLDFGGRYKLHRGFVLLFMAGRSLGGNSLPQVQFMGYLGIQILLSDYGRTLTPE